MGESLSPAAIVPDNPLQSARYESAVFTALCARAAIEGGISPETAHTLELLYTRQIHEAKTMTELRDVTSAVFGDFIDRVRKAKNTQTLSPAIRTACDYIDANLTHALTLEEIAAHSGYTKYYLSRCFLEEMGMRISDYIHTQRIEYARALLAGTSLSIQEISDLLQFSNRSYFSSLFAKQTGLTPTQYRAKKGDQKSDQKTEEKEAEGKEADHR